MNTTYLFRTTEGFPYTTAWTSETFKKKKKKKKKVRIGIPNLSSREKLPLKTPTRK